MPRTMFNNNTLLSLPDAADGGGFTEESKMEMTAKTEVILTRSLVECVMMVEAVTPGT